MKAEEIKFEILGIPYTQSTLTEMVKAYAKDQIEKDRERVKKNINPKWLNTSIDKTPIILD